MNRLVARFATQSGGSPVSSDKARPTAIALTLLALGACGSDVDSKAPPLTFDAGQDAGQLSTSDGAVIGLTPDTGTQVVPCTGSLPSADDDGDGFTGSDGDCNDCDKLINPGAFDFPGNMYDEDCSGSPAQAAETDCDVGLSIDSMSPQDAARAIGLCKFTSADKRDWGVIDARFTTADGSGALPNLLQVGLLPSFGVVSPLAGKSLLALSSGVARAPGQAGYTDDCDLFDRTGRTPPAGFPKESSICKDEVSMFLGGLFGLSTKVFDQAALELKIRVPTNANSLGFDSNFYSYEFPGYICSEFNDFYIALQEPRVPGAADGNIVFDANNDPIGVNTGLLAVCDKSTQPQNSEKFFDCVQGTGLLKGTGFGNAEYTCGVDSLNPDKGGAATGWLHTLAPAAPGSVITLRFAIWDTNDQELDSTVLIDKFEWSVEMPTGASTVAVPILL